MTIKNILFILILVSTFVVNLSLADDAVTSNLVSDAIKSHDFAKTKVEKVFVATDSDASYRAYLVKWKGQEVVIPDSFGTSTKKIGDEVTISISKLNASAHGKKYTLYFQLMDMEAFLNLGDKALTTKK